MEKEKNQINLFEIYTPSELARITWRDILFNRKKRKEDADDFIIESCIKCRGKRK